MQSIRPDIRSLNSMVLAVSVDTPLDNEKLARRKGIEFPILADPELKAIDAYGLRHPKGGPYGDVARPATFIINPEGEIVWRELTDNWRVRVRPEPVLEQLRKMKLMERQLN